MLEQQFTYRGMGLRVPGELTVKYLREGSTLSTDKIEYLSVCKVDISGKSQNSYWTNHTEFPYPDIDSVNLANRGSLYMDAKYSILLVLDKTLVAGIGFFVESKTVTVQQIQGAHAGHTNARTFQDVKWERLLLHVLCNWAFTHGFESVRVIESQDNNWCQPQSLKVPHLKEFSIMKEYNSKNQIQNISKEEAQQMYEQAMLAYERNKKAWLERQARFHMHYDVTPKRMGFVPSKKLSTSLHPSLNRKYHYSVMSIKRWTEKHDLLVY